MGKREADRQITKDDPSSSDDEHDTTVDGRWKEADSNTLAQRKIISVKRKTPASTSTANNNTNHTPTEPAKSAFPTFSFGSTSQSTTNNVTTPVNSTIQTHTDTTSSTSTTAASATSNATQSSAVPATTSAGATNNAWNKFALKSDEWKCPTCDITNKVKDTKCLACDTPNPAAPDTTDHNNHTTATPKFTFGVPTSNASSSSTTAPTFSFGSSTPSFSFGTTSAFSTASTGFSFGHTAATTGGFSFGSTVNNNNTTDDKHTNGTTTTYKFGQSNDTDSNGLNFASSADTGLVTESGTNAEFAGKSAEASGEENDMILCKQRTRCYKMSTVEKVDEKQPDTNNDDKSSTQTTAHTSDATPPTETKWLQIGEGELHVNLIPATDTSNKPKARFVLRTDKTQRLVLNSPILKHTPINLQNDKYIHFKSADLDGQFQLFLLKFKSRGEASAVLDAVDDAKTKVD